MRRPDEREKESASGAMRGSGGGAGSPDLPFPRTDAEDTGTGDGGLSAAEPRSSRSAGDHGERQQVAENADESSPQGSADAGAADDAAGRDRRHGGWGDEGIGGGRAGGTGL
jgi:hypothetical protein